MNTQSGIYTIKIKDSTDYSLLCILSVVEGEETKIKSFNITDYMNGEDWYLCNNEAGQFIFASDSLFRIETTMFDFEDKWENPSFEINDMDDYMNIQKMYSKDKSAYAKNTKMLEFYQDYETLYDGIIVDAYLAFYDQNKGGLDLQRPPRDDFSPSIYQFNDKVFNLDCKCELFEVYSVKNDFGSVCGIVFDPHDKNEDELTAAFNNMLNKLTYVKENEG